MGAIPYTLRQLEYAVAVAETGGFRKAAERSHVSQPALSAQLAQLEDSIGVRLFERDRRRVLVTPAGTELLARAKRILAEAADLQALARSYEDPFRGEMRVGIIPTIAPYLLAEITPALQERFPELRLLWSEEKTSTLVEMLEEGSLDAAVLALEADIGDVEHAEIAKDPFVLAAAGSHPFAKARSKMPIAKLSESCVYLLEDGHCFREQVVDLCSKVGSEEEAFRATSLATLVQLVASTGGLTLLPSLALGIENRHEQLKIRPLGAPIPYRTIALVWRRSTPFRDALKELAKTMRAAYPSST
jgi:LysR family hydrogen peroxide-inducible transcriptional activator